GADIRNILEFENDWQNAKTIILNQNYRSTNTILQAANAIISSVDKQSKQKLWSNLGKGTKIKLCKTDNEDAEAEYVTKEIQRLINIGNYKPKDIAVFYRMNSMSRPVEQALMFQAIPYKVIGGTKFYDRKEIRDIMAYLKIIHNPSDDISLLRIINFPTRGLGKTSLDKVIEFARSQSLSIYQALQQIDQITTLSPSTMRKFQDFTQMISFLQLTASDILNPKTATDITSFINDVVTKTALKEHFEFSTDPQDQVRLENIEAFVNVAKSWKTEEPEPTLEHFLEILALMSDTDDLPDTNQTDGFVSLMTLHSAKGLEYPIVFFIGLEDGTIPSSLSMNSQAELNEERRLAYVGVTRAKELLYLSWSTSRLVWGQITSFLPSPYLLDINLEIVTKEEYKNNKYSYKNNNKPKYKFHKY
ncbi:MAG: ATP-dependent helicase, partial [Bifidobacteriaceae bacterium]|nr:ATP-dependent helicase [Bifidobacteriaceae bacterium]